MDLKTSHHRPRGHGMFAQRHAAVKDAPEPAVASHNLFDTDFGSAAAGDQPASIIYLVSQSSALKAAARELHKLFNDPPSPQTASRPLNDSPPALPRQTRSIVLRRGLVKKKEVLKRYRLYIYRTRILLGGGAIAAVFLLVASVHQFGLWRNSQSANKKVLSATKINNVLNEAVDETEPDPGALALYKVSPDMPRVIKIPKINVEARIERIGVNKGSELQAPQNIFDAGWYDATAKPGEIGASLMTGHSTGPTKRGVFYSIGSLETGDLIQVERGDKQVITYSVIKVVTYEADKVDMSALLATVDKTKAGLNLLSYSGAYNVTTNHFESRVAIFASQTTK